jgi:S-adenosylmethionine:tRNA ribosyltransferase-isomerase
VLSSDFDYELPGAAVAQHPRSDRAQARLLVDGGVGVPSSHRTVGDLPDELHAGDLLVVNTTRVLPARLRLRKPTGGAAEVLLVSPLDIEPFADARARVDATGDASGAGGPLSQRWRAMVRPGRRLAPGVELVPAEPPPPGSPAQALVVRVGEDAGDGLREVTLEGVDDVLAALDDVGEVPLPPYITAELEDAERYQTVYARRPRSAAAPTAGLHLTDEVLDRCRAAGVTLAEVELVIGPGTFVPLTADRLDDHRMHAEWYEVPEATQQACRRAAQEGGQVVAVGTTVVRALESWASTGATSGATDLFIRPGFPFAVVDRLMTNFHQPRSTLLVLLESFMGPRWRQCYDEALDAGYRFLSFGDAMLVERDTTSRRDAAAGDGGHDAGA